MSEIHPWKRCRYGGCGDCCDCGEKCNCADNFTTAEDLIKFLQLLEPKTRIVIEGAGEDEYTFYDICCTGNPVALKPYTTEFVYRIYDEKLRGYKAPEHAEQCICISIRKE